jgi:hypothetical protein
MSKPYTFLFARIVIHDAQNESLWINIISTLESNHSVTINSHTYKFINVRIVEDSEDQLKSVYIAELVKYATDSVAIVDNNLSKEMEIDNHILSNIPILLDARNGYFSFAPTTGFEKKWFSE